MKRWKTLFWGLITSVALITAAHADVMFSPVLIAVGLFAQALPWLLVAAVVIVTVLILLRFRKKK